MSFDIAYLLGSMFGNILIVIPTYFIVNKLAKRKNSFAVFIISAIILTIAMGLLDLLTVGNIITVYIEIVLCLFANRYFESDDKEEVKNESKGA